MMEKTLEAPDLRPGSVVVRHSMWTGTKVVCDGGIVKGAKGLYTVPGSNGQPVTIRLRQKLPDPIPVVEVNGTSYPIAAPLPWYVWLWIAAPVALTFAGGALGAILGITATYQSASLFRGPRSTAMKWVLSGLVSLAAVVVFLVVGGGLQLLLKK